MSEDKTRYCEFCRYFEPISLMESDGDCKARPPVPATHVDDYARWPRVHYQDWCGAHQLDPDLIPAPPSEAA